MVVESPPAAEAQELLATLSNFLSDLWAMPLVHSVRINANHTPIDLWVLLDHEDVPTMKTILRRHWLLFERSWRPSIQLHVVPLDRVQLENVPPGRTIFERT